MHKWWCTGTSRWTRHATRRHPRAALTLVAVGVLLAGCVPLSRPPAPQPPQQPQPLPPIANNPTQSGWYQDQPGLTSAAISGGGFGQVFSATVDGQVYAGPTVVPTSAGKVLVVGTEKNVVYGFDAGGGGSQSIWSRQLETPWAASNIQCPDLAPYVGITSTPAIDPASGTAYFTDKTYANGTSGPAAYWVHAIDVATGAERSQFPVEIQGTASNDPNATFDATYLAQRTQLVLMDGVIYAGFGGLCDTPPYRGWVVGVSTAGAVTTRWTSEAGLPLSPSPDGGIWQSAAPLVSDGAGQLLAVTGNGTTDPTPRPGSSPGPTVGVAVVRLTVQADGSLQATDFFSPSNAEYLSSQDLDLGSSGLLLLPSEVFGTASVPHLAISGSKIGSLYLLNRDSLGGRDQGLQGNDAAVQELSLASKRMWSTPTAWPGDGGYVFVTAGFGPLTAFKYAVDASGNPNLQQAGTSSDEFGFTSSSPTVTSNGTAAGSAVVWTVYAPPNPSHSLSGVGAELRAYNAVPVNGVLTLLGHWPIGWSAKFTRPTVFSGRVFVGTRGAGTDTSGNAPGTVLGFG